MLDIRLIAEPGGDRRRYTESLGLWGSVLLHCCQFVGFHPQHPSTEVTVDLTCQNLEASVFTHGFTALDVIHD